MITIQTFFSLDKTEEVQIKGRIGRQSKKGEYILILHAADLGEELHLPITKDQLEDKDKYEILKNKLEIERTRIFGEQLETLNDKIKESNDKHNKTLEYQQSLLKKERDKAFQLLFSFGYKAAAKSSLNYHFIFALDDSGSMTCTDGTSKNRWLKVIDAVSAFIQERSKLTDQKSKDKVSIIYHSHTARIICEFVQLNQVEKSLSEPNWGGNNFYLAIQQIQTIISRHPDQSNIILFLSDGGDCNSYQKLEKSLQNLKTNYGNKIQRWWNIGFGAGADKTVLTEMISLIKSDTCEAIFKTSLSAKQLIEEFQDIACDTKLNF